jgi:ribosomal protein L18
MLQRNPSSTSNKRPPRRREPRLSARVRKLYRDAIEAHFEKRRRRLDVVATTRTPHGQIIDWVPIESQVRGGIVAMHAADLREPFPLHAPS